LVKDSDANAGTPQSSRSASSELRAVGDSLRASEEASQIPVDPALTERAQASSRHQSRSDAGTKALPTDRYEAALHGLIALSSSAREQKSPSPALASPPVLSDIANDSLEEPVWQPTVSVEINGISPLHSNNLEISHMELDENLSVGLGVPPTTPSSIAESLNQPDPFFQISPVRTLELLRHFRYDVAPWVHFPVCITQIAL